VLGKMGTNGIVQGNFFQWANWDSWIEEILCDLVGLVSFGPSFVAAQCNLLPSINLNTYGFGPRHPSSAWRINLILRGATILGFDSLPPEGHACRDKIQRFWDKMHLSRKTDSWCDVLTDAQLSDALAGVSQLLHQHTPAGYKHPDADVVWKLVRSLEQGIPPVGFELTAEGVPAYEDRDFREILYAGWIASVQQNAQPFQILNRLCEHAIMQQSAINIPCLSG